MQVFEKKMLIVKTKLVNKIAVERGSNFLNLNLQNFVIFNYFCTLH